MLVGKQWEYTVRGECGKKLVHLPHVVLPILILAEALPAICTKVRSLEVGTITLLIIARSTKGRGKAKGISKYRLRLLSDYRF